MRTTTRNYFGFAARLAVALLAVASGFISLAPIAAAKPPSADISVEISDAPDPATVGGEITYSITVRNAGPNPAQATEVTDALPSGVTFVSASSSTGSCSGTETVSCSLGNISAGGAATASIVVRADAEGTITNTASATSRSSDAHTSNNSATTETTVNRVDGGGSGGEQPPAEGPDNCSGTYIPISLWGWKTDSCSLVASGGEASVRGTGAAIFSGWDGEYCQFNVCEFGVADLMVTLETLEGQVIARCEGAGTCDARSSVTDLDAGTPLRCVVAFTWEEEYPHASYGAFGAASFGCSATT